MSKSGLIFSSSVFLVVIGIVANSLGVFNRTYGTEIILDQVGADTTFEAGITNLLTGPIPDADRAGGQVFIRVVGQLDDSARIIVPYDGYPHLTCTLPKGKFDTVFGGDFYASMAKIKFLHQGAKGGNLRINVAFSYPPEHWHRQFKQGHWAVVQQ
jgi:hypothetical protein